MESIVVLALIIVGTGLIVWRRRNRGQAAIADGPPPENFALKAFAHGNTCLAEGKFDDAIAAFRQALELEPKHPHVAGRLAEVERQKQAATCATSPAR